jgi:putative transposase
LTTGEVAAYFADVYGATVSKDTISHLTDKVVGEMAEWCHRAGSPRLATNKCQGQIRR